MCMVSSKFRTFQIILMNFDCNFNKSEYPSSFINENVFRKNLDQLLDEETSYLEDTEEDSQLEQVGYLAAQVIYR